MVVSASVSLSCCGERSHAPSRPKYIKPFLEGSTGCETTLACCVPVADMGVLFHLALIFPLLWPAIAAYDNGLPNGTCFDTAIPANLRKNLTTPQGESVPITFLLAGWSSAQITSSVIEILLTEIMGYNIAIGNRPPASSVDSIYCMLGCATWWDTTNRGCETRKITHHVMVESWYLGFPHVVAALTEMYQAGNPMLNIEQLT